MHPFTLAENLKVVEGLAPAADAAGRTSDIICLKNCHKVVAVVHINQGNAATVAVSLRQSTNVAGAGDKAGPSVPIWTNLDCAAGDTLTRQTDAASYTTDAALKAKQVILEIDPSKLDVAGGFDCISITTGASNAANITECTFYAVPRYPGDASPSMIID